MVPLGYCHYTEKTREYLVFTRCMLVVFSSWKKLPRFTAFARFTDLPFWRRVLLSRSREYLIYISPMHSYRGCCYHTIVTSDVNPRLVRHHNASKVEKTFYTARCERYFVSGNIFTQKILLNMASLRGKDGELIREAVN